MGGDMETVESFDGVVDLATFHGPLYVRYSRGPAADAVEASEDAEAGVTMPGLSVTSLTPEPWWSRPPEDWVARRLCKYLDLQKDAPDRRPWLLTGVVVGFGTDHEPLIGAAQPCGWVSDEAVATAQQLYRERFDVGDTTSRERETR